MSRSGFLDVPDSFISITPHTVYSIVVLLGDSHEPAEDMSAVFYDTGEVCKFGGKRYPLKRGVQVTPLPGELLSQVNQTTGRELNIIDLTPLTCANRPVRTRTPGGVGAGG